MMRARLTAEVAAPLAAPLAALLAACVLLTSGCAWFGGATQLTATEAAAAARARKRRKPILELPLLKGGRTYMVPMRDGTRLATDVYLAGPKPAGVVLFRSANGRTSFPAIVMSFKGLGYHTIVQAARGLDGSEGEAQPMLDDGWGMDLTRSHWDSYDTIEWIARQPWCNGTVAMWGASALGTTAFYAAGSGHPNLTCLSVAMAAWDLYHHGIRQGGGYRQSDVEVALEYLAPAAGYQKLAREGDVYDERWRRASPSTRLEHFTAPVLHVGGWFDPFVQATIDAFNDLQYRGGPGARGHQKLVIGPWGHGTHEKRKQGQLTLPPESRGADMLIAHEVAWFAHYLRGEGSLKDIPTVIYWLMGDVDELAAPGNEWRKANEFPPPSEPRYFYLTAEGGLADDLRYIETRGRSFDYDPAKPVPTHGGANLVLTRGPHDQREVDAGRDDVLVYRSEPLERPLEVIGRVKAILYGASDRVDTDWVVKLCDVYPDGRAMLVCDGLLRAKFWKGFEEENLLEPGAIYPFEVDLWTTAIVFNTGHRIQISVTSSNAPRFQPNPNTGEPVWRGEGVAEEAEEAEEAGGEAGGEASDAEEAGATPEAESGSEARKIVSVDRKADEAGGTNTVRTTDARADTEEAPNAHERRDGDESGKASWRHASEGAAGAKKNEKKKSDAPKRAGLVAHNTVYHGAFLPSALVLPVTREHPEPRELQGASWPSERPAEPPAR